MKERGEKYGYAPSRPHVFTNRLHRDQMCECGELVLAGDSVAYYEDALLHERCAMEAWERDT